MDRLDFSPEPECSLVDLVNLSSFASLPTPAEDEAYAVFRVRNFSESGVQAFIRLVPALGLAMARSKIPLGRVRAVADLIELVGGLLADGRLDAADLFLLASFLRKL